MRARQGPSAEPAVEPQLLRTKQLDLRGLLSVPELADVVVAPVAVLALVADPAEEMSLPACMSRWPSTTRWP